MRIFSIFNKKKLTGYLFKKTVLFSPVSRVFGFDRGLPIDRYYIESFLEKNSLLIKGCVLEIAENTYSKKFGTNVSSYEIFGFTSEQKNATIIGDLTNLNSLPEGVIDCFICTQTLNFIYDFNTAIKGIHKLLAKGGNALVTVGGISKISKYDADRWGDFWRFNPQGIEKAFKEVFGNTNVNVIVYGNSYTATMFLNGFALGECEKGKLDYIDEEYPVTIALVVKKSN